MKVKTDIKAGVVLTAATAATSISLRGPASNAQVESLNGATAVGPGGSATLMNLGVAATSS